MFEKVNAGHPDKMADRLAGAVVDLVYERAGGLTKANPRVACEVLAGHGKVYVMIETSLTQEQLSGDDIDPLIHRIFGEDVEGKVTIVPQDVHLADNQQGSVRCGDNGIFKGCAPTHEQRLLTAIATSIYDKYPTDGKYLVGDANAIVSMGRDGRFIVDATESRIKCLDNLKTLTICQSHASIDEIDELIREFFAKNGGKLPTGNDEIVSKETGQVEIKTTAAFLKGKWYAWGNTINPLGEWTGGINTDCGATNRKLGSDMGDGVTGGGLHGKDLSKADVSVNIFCYLESIRTGHEVTACCSIGDETVCGIPYKDIVEQARLYIQTIGGFEKFAMWGLIRAKD